MKRLHNKNGFTLIELLIVIAVLGILAAMAIPSFQGVAESFKKKTDIESAKILAREVEVLLLSGVFHTGPNGTFKKPKPNDNGAASGVVSTDILQRPYTQARFVADDLTHDHTILYLIPVLSDATNDKVTVSVKYGMTSDPNNVHRNMFSQQPIFSKEVFIGDI